MSAIHPSTREVRGPSQTCENCTVPATSGYARYARPKVWMVVLACLLAPGWTGVTRISAGLAVGVLSGSGVAAPGSGVGTDGCCSADGGVVLERDGRLGARDFEGAQAAMTTDAENASPARKIVRRLGFVSIDVQSDGGNSAS